MRILRKLFSTLIIFLLVLTVFFSAGLVTVFLIGEFSGHPVIPEMNTEEDVKRWLKSIGDTTSIPGVSGLLSSIDVETVPSELLEADFSRFDTEFFPYFRMLSEDQKIVYVQLYEAAQECRKELAMPVYSLTNEEAEAVWEAVFYDHPELFWLEESASFHYYANGGVTQIDLHYNDLVNNLEQNLERFDQAVNLLLEEAAYYSSDYERELYLHNAVLNLCEYDLDAAYSQSAFSALVNGRSVCAGYAKAYQLLLMKCGIPCYYASGWSGENHAWNIVQLEDGYYNVDLTWDDGTNSLLFFNRTDIDLAHTHERRDMAVQLPLCQAEAHHNTEPIPPIDLTQLGS